MAPVYVKGGVWTNVEDEILKAAVSKYGLNQWARVASLLPKKSAKQAKARWNEWINPNIDKSDWTREQDDKLLNLAKLLPNQWRTIASMMGRTATHCVERYQKLIDEAAGIAPTTQDNDNEESLGLTGPGIESLPATGPSLEKAGDLNINPESRPARPDEEDMNDEEREMLAEAKARLANTQGKKAKRKARERMLEESKRIALLQKRRELKAAGISFNLDAKNKKKSRKEFDYNADIPHEHAIPEGLYDVSEEISQNDSKKFQFNKEVSRSGIQMEQHNRDKKSKDIKKGEQKQTNKHKLEIEEAANFVGELKENEITKRRKLNLPIPLIDDSVVSSKQESPGQAPIISKAAKSKIVELFKSSLGSIPKPTKHHQNPVPVPVGSVLNENEALNITDSWQQDQGERLKDLELLQQLDEEKAKLRRSQAIQRGLPVPRIDRSSETDGSVSELDILINDEMQKLIRSDYRRFYDSAYRAPLVEDLDEESFETVNKEVDQEMSSIGSIPKPVSSNFGLPCSHAVGEKIVNKLHELYRSSEEKQKELEDVLKQPDSNDKSQLIAITFQELREVDEDYNFVCKRLLEEETAIAAESERLHKFVDDLNKAKAPIEDRIRTLRIQRR